MDVANLKFTRDSIFDRKEVSLSEMIYDCVIGYDNRNHDKIDELTGMMCRLLEHLYERELVTREDLVSIAGGNRYV